NPFPWCARTPFCDDMDQPRKTLADYVMVAISPVLIMLLVGSLAFFLIQVFYCGEMVHGVRWTMFWFVLAIVLVSRIGIELGKIHARIYGVALALATWIYLAYTHKTPGAGAILLGITWLCAHKLTVDCTLIRDDETEGMFQKLWRILSEQIDSPNPLAGHRNLSALELKAAANLMQRRRQAPPRAPGRSLIFFSLAALPLFGIGQKFLPAADPQARHAGFAFLVVYLGSAFGLMLTTSFLGLRRNLRLHAVELPANVTSAWLKFGALVTAGVLLLALILPRPGGLSVWKQLAYVIPHREHKASPVAPPFNSPGKDDGQRAIQPSQQTSSASDTRRTPPGGGAGNARNDNSTHSNSRTDSNQSGGEGGGGEGGSGASGGGHTGDQGSGGKGGDNTFKTPSIRLKDVVPSGNADDSSDNKKDNSPPTTEPNENVRDGQGGRPPVEPSAIRDKPGKNSATKPAPKPKPTVAPTPPPDQPVPPPPKLGEKQPDDYLYQLLRALLILVLAVFVIWVLIRFRKPIAKMARAAWTALCEFFRKLFRRQRKPAAAKSSAIVPPLPQPGPFATYQNPFITGTANTWTREHLLRHTYEAIQAWAKERGLALKPPQTPREFCRELIEQFPEAGPDLEQFSIYYSQVAFARRLPDDIDLEPLRRLWQFLGDSVTVTAA
ncbi:MAG TPA: DUF4129 domain-containing protein, partial [Verrucomicrobiae bacterium]